MDHENTKGLEGSMLQAYDRDGMLETLLGLALLGGGLNLIAAGGTVTGLLPIIIILMARAWKRRITYPRLGYAEILTIRRTQRKRTVLVILLAICGIAGVALVAGLGSGVIQDVGGFFGQARSKLFFGVFLSVIIASIGMVRKAPHIYAVAVLLFALIVVTNRMQLSGGYALTLTGLLIAGFGLVRLAVFLKANPRLEGSAQHDAGS